LPFRVQSNWLAAWAFPSIGIQGSQVLQAPVDHAHVCLLRGGKPNHKELDLNNIRDKENPGAIL
jgi:hypothetical protein